MIRSLYLYGNNLAKMALNGNLGYVLHEIRRYGCGHKIYGNIAAASVPVREEALRKVVAWLLRAQEKMADDGFGSYHAALGWGSSYPETTGYIIPSLLNFAERYEDERCKTAAVCAGDFLLEIQKPSGGWQGGRIGENRPEIVFNTGQVIRGMIALHLFAGENKYLDSAVKAADWLCQVQHPEGYWKEFALMNEARVYDSFVDAPLLQLYHLTGNEKYKVAALRNLRWITDKKMKPNGWFEDCDNTIKRNDVPILHTIAYTLDGLLESDDYLEDGTFRKAAAIGADALNASFLSEGRFYGRYDREWKGSEFMLCTGAAQMSMVWMRMFRLTGERSYLEAATMALDILIFVQDRGKEERPDSAGALPGSFPIWGRYEPFAFPNWASKFFADALMSRAEIND
jgi:uncharacterized protein YyaL (SSP411 family)